MSKTKGEYHVRRIDLVKLRRAGLGRCQIAKLYGCHETTVRSWLIKFGLPTDLPKRGPAPSQVDAFIRRHGEIHGQA